MWCADVQSQCGRCRAQHAGIRPTLEDRSLGQELMAENNCEVIDEGKDDEAALSPTHSVKLSLTVIDTLIQNSPIKDHQGLTSPGSMDWVDKALDTRSRVHQGPRACFPYFAPLFALLSSFLSSGTSGSCISVHWCGIRVQGENAEVRNTVERIAARQGMTQTASDIKSVTCFKRQLSWMHRALQPGATMALGCARERAANKRAFQ